MTLQVEKIVEPLVLGEGPHWDDRQQALFFVNINECTIHKYVPATGEHTKTKVGGRVGFIVPVEGTTDQFAVGVERKFQVVEWDGKDGSATRVVKELGEVDKDIPTNRINDGKADPKGRLFAGTMSEGDLSVVQCDGSFYRVDGRGVAKQFGHVAISNGLCWDPQRGAMYYIDSLDVFVRGYDYNLDTGEMSNQKTVFDLKKNGIDGFPDGMTIDTEGNIWVAVFDGSAVVKVDPAAGKVLQKVPIPAKKVTSVTFGGPNYDVLFVTSARLTEEGASEHCGATFMVTGLGVKGYPNVSFKLP